MRDENDIHHRGDTHCQTFVVVLMLWPETIISKDGFYPPDAPDPPGIYLIKSGA